MENPNKNVTGEDSNNIGNVQNNNIQNSAYERISDICNSIIADERLYGMDELVYKIADIKYLRCPSSNVNFFKFHNTLTLHKIQYIIDNISNTPACTIVRNLYNKLLNLNFNDSNWINPMKMEDYKKLLSDELEELKKQQ